MFDPQKCKKVILTFQIIFFNLVNTPNLTWKIFAFKLMKVNEWSMKTKWKTSLCSYAWNKPLKRPLPYVQKNHKNHTSESSLRLQNFSDMTVRICSNLECRSIESAPAPLLPQRNLRWNSVWNILSVRSSILASAMTISAFLR